MKKIILIMLIASIIIVMGTASASPAIYPSKCSMSYSTKTDGGTTYYQAICTANTTPYSYTDLQNLFYAVANYNNSTANTTKIKEVNFRINYGGASPRPFNLDSSFSSHSFGIPSGIFSADNEPKFNLDIWGSWLQSNSSNLTFGKIDKIDIEWIYKASSVYDGRINVGSLTFSNAIESLVLNGFADNGSQGAFIIAAGGISNLRTTGNVSITDGYINEIRGQMFVGGSLSTLNGTIRGNGASGTKLQVTGNFNATGGYADGFSGRETIRTIDKVVVDGSLTLTSADIDFLNYSGSISQNTTALQVGGNLYTLNSRIHFKHPAGIEVAGAYSLVTDPAGNFSAYNAGKITADSISMNNATMAHTYSGGVKTNTGNLTMTNSRIHFNGSTPGPIEVAGNANLTGIKADSTFYAPAYVKVTGNLTMSSGAYFVWVNNTGSSSTGIDVGGNIQMNSSEIYFREDQAAKVHIGGNATFTGVGNNRSTLYCPKSIEVGGDMTATSARFLYINYGNASSNPIGVHVSGRLNSSNSEMHFGDNFAPITADGDDGTATTDWAINLSGKSSLSNRMLYYNGKIDATNGSVYIHDASGCDRSMCVQGMSGGDIHAKKSILIRNVQAIDGYNNNIQGIHADEGDIQISQTTFRTVRGIGNSGATITAPNGNIEITGCNSAYNYSFGDSGIVSAIRAKNITFTDACKVRDITTADNSGAIISATESISIFGTYFPDSGVGSGDIRKIEAQTITMGGSAIGRITEGFTADKWISISGYNSSAGFTIRFSGTETAKKIETLELDDPLKNSAISIYNTRMDVSGNTLSVSVGRGDKSIKLSGTNTINGNNQTVTFDSCIWESLYSGIIQYSAFQSPGSAASTFTTSKGTVAGYFSKQSGTGISITDNLRCLTLPGGGGGGASCAGVTAVATGSNVDLTALFNLGGAAAESPTIDCGAAGVTATPTFDSATSTLTGTCDYTGKTGNFNLSGGVIVDGNPVNCLYSQAIACVGSSCSTGGGGGTSHDPINAIFYVNAFILDNSTPKNPVPGATVDVTLNDAGGSPVCNASSAANPGLIANAQGLIKDGSFSCDLLTNSTYSAIVTVNDSTGHSNTFGTTVKT